MPIYEYRCRKCNRTFEVIQKFSDDPLTTHKDCGGDVERLISSPALQFKGSGWYITDYARKDSGAANGKSEDKKEAKTETKGESTSSTESKSTPAKSETSTTKSDTK